MDLVLAKVDTSSSSKKRIGIEAVFIDSRVNLHQQPTPLHARIDPRPSRPSWDALPSLHGASLHWGCDSTHEPRVISDCSLHHMKLDVCVSSSRTASHITSPLVTGNCSSQTGFACQTIRTKDPGCDSSAVCNNTMRLVSFSVRGGASLHRLRLPLRAHMSLNLRHKLAQQNACTAESTSRTHGPRADHTDC